MLRNAARSCLWLIRMVENRAKLYISFFSFAPSIRTNAFAYSNNNFVDLFRLYLYLYFYSSLSA